MILFILIMALVFSPLIIFAVYLTWILEAIWKDDKHKH